jgi:hypothetical protein
MARLFRLAMVEAVPNREKCVFGTVIAIEGQGPLGPIGLLAVVRWPVVEPGEAVAQVPREHQLYRRIGQCDAEIFSVSLRNNGIALRRIVASDVVLVHVHFSQIHFEAHLVDGLNVASETLAKFVGLSSFYVALDAHGIERHAALLHPAQQFEDQASPFRAVVVVVFNSIVVIGEFCMGIGAPRGAKRQIDVIRPDLVVPERFPQPAGLAIFGKNRLVDHVPRLQLAREVFANGGNVIDEKLSCVWTILRSLNPLGNGLMPAECVAAHQHVILLRELQQKIGPREVVAVGCGSQRDPL